MGSEPTPQAMKSSIFLFVSAFLFSYLSSSATEYQVIGLLKPSKPIELGPRGSSNSFETVQGYCMDVTLKEPTNPISYQHLISGDAEINIVGGEQHIELKDALTRIPPILQVKGNNALQLEFINMHEKPVEILFNSNSEFSNNPDSYIKSWFKDFDPPVSYYPTKIQDHIWIEQSVIDLEQLYLLGFLTKGELEMAYILIYSDLLYDGFLKLIVQRVQLQNSNLTWSGGIDTQTRQWLMSLETSLSKTLLSLGYQIREGSDLKSVLRYYQHSKKIEPTGVLDKPTKASLQNGNPLNLKPNPGISVSKKENGGGHRVRFEKGDDFIKFLKDQSGTCDGTLCLVSSGDISFSVSCGFTDLEVSTVDGLILSGHSGDHSIQVPLGDTAEKKDGCKLSSQYCLEYNSLMDIVFPKASISLECGDSKVDLSTTDLTLSSKNYSLKL